MGAGATGCARGPAVLTDSALPLRRVVVYRNGVGYFERQGQVSGDEVRFRVLQSEVGDFLATLAVMEEGGSSVRAAAFPMPPESTGDETPSPRARRDVRVSLDGRNHHLVVGYTVETPIWRPSYRLVFGEQGNTPQVQAWGIVQNLSGEDWRDVRLSLVAGAPVSFRSELAQATIPPRPVVTDRGAVIDAVPLGETTLAQEAPTPAAPPPPPTAAPMAEAAAMAMADDASEGEMLRQGAANTRSRRPAPSRAMGGRGGAPMPMQAPQGNTAPTFQPSQAPRNLNALAALAAQGGTTRYDLPNALTVPNNTATMVMLTARDVPGEQMFLFAPDPGVGDSASHPFHVARFENRTGALLERGPIAIFESGAFLGQGMLEALPDGATTTVPFALERGLAVESSTTYATEGARLVRLVRESLTIERYNVARTTYRVRNGLDRSARVLLRHGLGNAEIFQPPTGTETSNGNALVPLTVERHSRGEIVVTTRVAFNQGVDMGDEHGLLAIEQWLRDANPPAATATLVRSAVDLRRQIAELSRERDTQVQRREDLAQNSEETRENLRAIQRNATANDLRQQLTARLARIATDLDATTRRIVELDTQIGERRVRLAEAVRGLDVDTTARNPAP